MRITGSNYTKKPDVCRKKINFQGGRENAFRSVRSKGRGVQTTQQNPKKHTKKTTKKDKKTNKKKKKKKKTTHKTKTNTRGNSYSKDADLAR